jgi:hypothetical protein
MIVKVEEATGRNKKGEYTWDGADFEAFVKGATHPEPDLLPAPPVDCVNPPFPTNQPFPFFTHPPPSPLQSRSVEVHKRLRQVARGHQPPPPLYVPAVPSQGDVPSTALVSTVPYSLRRLLLTLLRWKAPPSPGTRSSSCKQLLSPTFPRGQTNTLLISLITLCD